MRDGDFSIGAAIRRVSAVGSRAVRRCLDRGPGGRCRSGRPNPPPKGAI